MHTPRLKLLSKVYAKCKTKLCKKPNPCLASLSPPSPYCLRSDSAGVSFFFIPFPLACRKILELNVFIVFKYVRSSTEFLLRLLASSSSPYLPPLLLLAAVVLCVVGFGPLEVGQLVEFYDLHKIESSNEKETER